MARLLSKAESALFWKEDEEYMKVMGISMTKGHRKVLKGRIKQKIGRMIDLLSVTSLEYIPDPKALVEMIDRNIRKIKENPNFLDQKTKDTFAIALKCYAYDLESKEQRERRAMGIVEETKAFHREFEEKQRKTKRL